MRVCLFCVNFKIVSHTSKVFLIYFLHYSDHCIQRHCHDTKQYDGHQKPIHLKHLAGVDDQIAEPFPGGQKFSDDNTYKAETNVDFMVLMIVGTAEGSTTFVRT